MSKSSRKKLLQEPDEFLSLTHRIVLWAHENRNQALAIAGGVVGLVVVVLLAKSLIAQSHEKRSQALSAAVARYAQAPAGKAPADLVQELSRLSQKYSGSPEGQAARYLEAGAQASSGEVEKARGIYRELAAPGAAPAELQALSAVGLAYLELAQGGPDKALPAFQALLGSKDGAVPRAQILLEIAGIHEKAGRTADALQVYRELAAEHPDGSWSAQVKERLRALGDRGPAAS